MKQITHFSILQSSKILSILSFVVSAIFAIPLGLYTLYYQEYDVARDFFLQPIFHFVIAFISSVIFFFLYNQLAKWLGGIKCTLENVDEVETVEKH